MGQRGADCWQEIWPIIGPQIEGVMTRGEPTWHEDALVPIFRNARIEEVYWTYGYSPVFGDNSDICGTLVVCTETTSRVLSSRRLAKLGQLTEVASISTSTQLVHDAFSALATAREDIPFAALVDEAGRFIASVGIAQPADRSWILQSTSPEVRTLPDAIFAAPWPQPVTDAFVVPNRIGTFVFGISPRLGFDDAYREYLLQIVKLVVDARGRFDAVAARAAIDEERRNLMLQAPVATALLVGPDHVFELANRRYVEMVGREVTGKAYLEAFPELAGSPLPGVLDDVYLRGIPFVTEELLIPLDRGHGIERCFFKFNLEPIRDQRGTIIGMMAIAVEITEIVRARDERQALIAELQAASQAKDEFLALLGHELRNPLAPILTALDVITARGSDPAVREHQIIARQAKHLTRLVDDLIDVARIVRGEIELRREVVDLEDVVEKAIENATPMIESRRHALDVHLPPERIRWHADPVRLAQAVANLLTNAARYTEPGGRISLAIARVANEVEIRVTDDGTGISAEFLPRVFDHFARSKEKSMSGGLGIGLTLVKRLAELHGGTATATSAGIGRGSTFTIRLPLLQLPAESPASPEPVASPQGKRILLVDDNVDAALMMADMLAIKGHVVEVAHDGPAALAKLTTFQPEVAVLDIGMPVMNGYELAKRIRQLVAIPPRLVALTGYGRERDRDEAHDAGFQIHLVKPVAFGVLVRAIEG